MTSFDTTWKRVTRDNPCPVCCKPDWCGVTDDSAMVVCMRTESARPTANGGWLHVLDGERSARPHRAPDLVLRTRPDFSALATHLRNNLPTELLERFAGFIGVTAASLRLLGTGWDGDRRCLSWPMTDATGRVVGVRLRDARTGSKFAERGSREGLFVPAGADRSDPVLIVEGPTDTAAALDLGFDVIGRPSCTGGTKPLARLTHGRRVVIVSDRDAPGRRGAQALATALVPTVLELRVIEPPAPHKDLRAWLQAGATHDDVQSVIEAVEPRRLKVTYRTKEVTRG